MADNLPVFSTPIVDENGLVDGNWRDFFMGVYKFLRGQADTNWDAPTGTGSRVTFDMNWNPAISNPPTQAQVEDVRDQTRRMSTRLGQLIIDLQDQGILGD